MHSLNYLSLDFDMIFFSAVDSLTEKILDLVVRPALLKKYPNCC